MSVAGCYTDFHIDFGGSSVWYHILKGAKVRTQLSLFQYFFYSLFSELRLNSKTQYIYLMQVLHPNFREIIKRETASSPEVDHSWGVRNSIFGVNFILRTQTEDVSAKFNLCKFIDPLTSEIQWKIISKLAAFSCRFVKVYMIFFSGYQALKG